MCTCDVDLSGVTALTPPVAGDNGPTVTGIGGLLGVPLNTSSSFCVNCANPCVAIQVETIMCRSGFLISIDLVNVVTKFSLMLSYV